jgi:hypothetical protein
MQLRGVPFPKFVFDKGNRYWLQMLRFVPSALATNGDRRNCERIYGERPDQDDIFPCLRYKGLSLRVRSDWSLAYGVRLQHNDVTAVYVTEQ